MSFFRDARNTFMMIWHHQVGEVKGETLGKVQNPARHVIAHLCEVTARRKPANAIPTGQQLLFRSLLGAVHKLCRLGLCVCVGGGSPKDDLLHRPYKLKKKTNKGRG